MKKKRDFADGVKNLEKLEFEIRNRRMLTRLPSPRQKTKELHTAFSNRDVDIILAQRGGYSCMKLLPHLDFALMRRNPKLFAGFSDLSVLLNAIYERTGRMTLHSPMIINFSQPSRFTIQSFLNAVKGFPRKDLFAGAPVTVYRSGVGRGTLKGGNLVTLTALMGTDWEVKTDGAILFFEDVNEKLYQVDRNLTHWILAGKFRRVKGLILGNFKGLRSQEVCEILPTQMKIEFPLVHCPYIGHVKNKISLPVGARVELNTAKKSLTIL